MQPLHGAFDLNYLRKRPFSAVQQNDTAAKSEGKEMTPQTHYHTPTPEEVARIIDDAQSQRGAYLARILRDGFGGLRDLLRRPARGRRPVRHA